MCKIIHDRLSEFQQFHKNSKLLKLQIISIFQNDSYLLKTSFDRSSFFVPYFLQEERSTGKEYIVYECCIRIDNRAML